MNHTPDTSNLLLHSVLKEISALGCQYAFGIPGDDPLLQAVIENSFEWITMRDERSACFSAQAYSKFHGLGVCSTAHGPGMTNLVTGLAAATLDQNNVLAICSQLPLDHSSPMEHMYVPHDVLRPVSLLVNTVESNNKASDLERLFFQLKNGLMGARVLVVPSDQTNFHGCFHAAHYTARDSQQEIDPVSKSRALTLFRNSTRPIAVIGGGAVRDDATAVVRELLGRSKIPTMTTLHAKGIAGKGMDNTVSRHFKNWESFLNDADLVILIGVDSAEGLPNFWRLKPSVEISEQPSLSGQYHVQLQGGVSGILYELMEVFPVRTDSFPLVNALPAGVYQHPIGIVARATSEFSGTVTVDTGLFKHAWAVCFIAERPNQIVFSNGLSSIGWSLGAAIGSCYATGSPSLAVMGDGGFSMAMPELATIMQHGIPVSCLIVNDGTYGMIGRLQQQVLGNPLPSVVLRNPDYKSIANAFSLDYVDITDIPPSQLAEIVIRAGKIPSLLEFRASYHDFLLQHC